MRDLVITLVVFGSIPWIISRPFVGIVLWSWLGYMNPHRLCWGFAIFMPFAQIVALATFIGLLSSRDNKSLPLTRESITLILLIAWMLITTIFSLNPEGAWLEWNKVWKIQLMTFVTMMVVKETSRLHWLAWTIALSLGFYGIKGGIFTILTGGSYKVWGPPGSFIGGNNEIGLALIMTIPLIRYLHMQATQLWLKLGLLGAIVFSTVSIIGTHSRGALLGILAMGAMLILKGRNRFIYGLLAIVGAVVLYQFMPESWHERMGTIKTYDQDASAMGRINAWGFAVNVAKSHFFGGGFEVFRAWLFEIYAPNPADYHDAHSIYFEVLGEHGFIGLILFLMLGFFTWQSAGRCARDTDRLPELKQLGDLMRMVQVSLVGYAVSGAFLGLAYFDLYYHLVAMVVSARYILRMHRTTNVDKMTISKSQPAESFGPRKVPSFVRKPVRARPNPGFN
jgi:probable O-glycosylation ligase (exosortase A-associated)